MPIDEYVRLLIESWKKSMRLKTIVDHSFPPSSRVAAVQVWVGTSLVGWQGHWREPLTAQALSACQFKKINLLVFLFTARHSRFYSSPLIHLFTSFQRIRLIRDDSTRFECEEVKPGGFIKLENENCGRSEGGPVVGGVMISRRLNA